VRRWLKRYLAEGVEGLRETRLIRVLHARLPRSIASSWYRRSGAVLAVWGCLSRCGRLGAWPTTWLSKTVSGWSTRPSECT
jgi:hypothetical protein